MQYHVGRHSQPLGQFVEAEIREGLERGTFHVSDLVWHQGMTEWKRLDQVFGFAAAQTLSAPMHPPGFTGGPMTPMIPVVHGAVGVMPTPGTAIASLVLGIFGLLALATGFVGAVVAVPGVICGHMALGQINRSGGMLQGRGVAVAGLATSYASIAIGLLMILAFGIIFGIAAASGTE